MNSLLFSVFWIFFLQDDKKHIHREINLRKSVEEWRYISIENRNVNEKLWQAVDSRVWSEKEIRLKSWSISQRRDAANEYRIRRWMGKFKIKVLFRIRIWHQVDPSSPTPRLSCLQWPYFTNMSWMNSYADFSSHIRPQNQHQRPN